NLGDRLMGIFRSYVGDVCDLLRVSDMVEDTGRATRRNWIALAISGPSLRCIVQRYVPEYIAVVEQQVAEAGLADANSVLQHGLKHGLKARRASLRSPEGRLKSPSAAPATRSAPPCAPAPRRRGAHFLLQSPLGRRRSRLARSAWW